MSSARHWPPLLIATVGLPYAGKSTWARQTGLPIVSPDAIRRALHGRRFLDPAEPMVWTLARYMVRALFAAGHDRVILDATNSTEARRSEWRSREWTLRFALFLTPRDECIARAIDAGDIEIVSVIERMDDAFECPPVEECIDAPDPEAVRHLVVSAEVP